MRAARRGRAGPWTAAVLALLPVLVLAGLRAKGPPRCDRIASMITLELAGTAERARAVLAEWHQMAGLDGQQFAEAVRRALLWGGLFALAYVAALAACAQALRAATRGRGWIARAAPWVTWAALAAGVLDLVENAALWQGVPVPAGAWPRVAQAAAAVKLTLAGAAVLFVAVAATLLVARRLRRPVGTWSMPLLLAVSLGNWATSYPVLLATATLLVGVVWGVFLDSIGLPGLFWHERTHDQFLAGVGVGVLAADLGLVGFLLDATAPWMRRLADGPGFPVIANRPVRALLRYLLLTSGVVAALAVGGWPWAAAETRWPLPFGVISGAIGYGVLAVRVWTTRLPAWAIGRLPSPVRYSARQARRGGVAGSELDGLALVLMALRLGLIAVLVVAAASTTRWAVPPGFSICVLLSTAVAVYGLLVFFFPLRRFGIVAVLVVVGAVVNGLAGPNHHIAEMDYTTRKPRPGDAQPIGLEASGLADDRRVLETWIERNGPRGPLVVVAVDGGGVRASTWAMSVLTQLEEDLGPGFPGQVRLVTGASGGMMGAAYYVASLRAPGEGWPHRHRGADGEILDAAALLDGASRDALTPLGERLVLHDMIPLLNRFGGDRGTAIQEAWDENTRGLFRQTLRSLQRGEVEGWRPSLVLSPVIVEDGRQLLISNLDLNPIATQATPQRNLGRGQLEFARLFPDAARLKLGTAVRMSATFPYVMPALELPTTPGLRTVDAGYYDEHGVSLAAHWLLHHSALIRERVDRVILVEVPDTLASVTKAGPCNDRRSALAVGLSGLTTPVEALLAGHGALALHGNDGLIERVAAALNTPDNPHRFQSVAFEPPYGATECGACARPEDEVALSWYVDASDRERLVLGMAQPPNTAKRELIRSWWTPALPRPPEGPPADGSPARLTSTAAPPH